MAKRDIVVTKAYKSLIGDNIYAVEIEGKPVGVHALRGEVRNHIRNIILTDTTVRSTNNWKGVEIVTINPHKLFETDTDWGLNYKGSKVFKNSPENVVRVAVAPDDLTPVSLAVATNFLRRLSIHEEHGKIIIYDIVDDKKICAFVRRSIFFTPRPENNANGSLRRLACRYIGLTIVRGITSNVDDTNHWVLHQALIHSISDILEGADFESLVEKFSKGAATINVSTYTESTRTLYGTEEGIVSDHIEELRNHLYDEFSPTDVFFLAMESTADVIDSMYDPSELPPETFKIYVAILFIRYMIIVHRLSFENAWTLYNRLEEEYCSE